MHHLRLPQPGGSFSYRMSGKAAPAAPVDTRYNRSVYAAAHVVIDPLRSADPWDGPPAMDWDATLRFREHLWGLGFQVAEAMDTAQRGMGVDWPIARELIQRSLRHARTIDGAGLACGVGTDQLPPTAPATLDDVEKAYMEQLAVVEAEGGRAIMMASRALARCARGPEDYADVYGRILGQASRPVILHWLGDMFDPALAGYWGSRDITRAAETVAGIIGSHAARIEGLKISLLDPAWERQLRQRLPPGIKMYTGDDFHYADLIGGDADGFSHGLLGIFDAIAPVAAAALSALAQGHADRFRALLDPTVALSREIFKTPTRHYKAGIVFLAWLNGHQSHFSMAAGLHSARDAVHYARVFALADQAGALQDPDLAAARMHSFLDVSCGCRA